ncbi:MAG: hypothetical protein ACR2G7_05825 [Acidimicrobiales bacterium]
MAVALSIVFALAAIGVVRQERRRWGARGFASPLSLTAVSWFFYFGIAGLGGFATAAADRRLGSEPMNLVTALAVCMLSLVLVVIGYRLVTRRAVLPSAASAAVGPLAIKPGGLYLILAVGWAARLYLLESGHFGFLSGGETYTGPINRLVQAAAAGLTIGLVVLVIAAWSPAGMRGMTRGASRRLLVANLAPLVLTSAASGLKGQLFTEVVPLAVAYLMVRGRVPWRAVAAVAVYLILIYSGTQDYRTEILVGNLDASERVGVVNSVRNSLTSVTSGWGTDTPVENAQSLWRHLTGQYSEMLTNLAIILHRTPEEVPFLGNRRLITGPVFFLPTSLLGDHELNITRYVNVVYRDSTATSSSPPTQPGDFYLSGGWPTLVVGQIMVGVFTGALWQLVVLRHRSSVGIVVYAAVSAVFVTAGLDWATLSRGLLQTVGVAWITMALIRRRDPIGAGT